MTSQKDQIQRLIAEIEATLAKPASRLPLGLSAATDRQRQLLGKLVNYLQSLEQLFDSPGGWGPIDPGTGQFVASQPATADVEESASQVLQGLLLEMKYLRENSLKPMRQELETLQQKRDSLQAEVNVLEAQRTQPLQSEQQINAFLETLMQRLQEQLSAQMVQNFAAMEAATIEQLSVTDTPSPLLSEQRLEQVRLLQAQSDQLLLKLDSTLTAVFDSLQKSVDSYRDSLEAGLDQMHGLGRQGEVIFHAFINHLAQQLGQDASLYLTGDLGKAVQQATLQEQDSVTTDVDLNAVQLDQLDQALENLALEESLGEDVLNAPTDTAMEVDPDLGLLEDAIAPEDDEEITLIQTDTLPDLAQLEDAISFGEDEEITLIQTDSDFEQGLDLELDEEITVIQTDADFDIDLLAAAISSDDIDDTTIPDASITDGDNSAESVSSLLETSPLLETVVETEETTTEAIEEATEDITADLTTEPAPLHLDAGLGALDESLELLASGAESSQGLNAEETSRESNQVGIPQLDNENDLFSFDAFDTDDVDLGLESDEAETDSVDLLATALFSEEATTAESEADGGSAANSTDATDLDNYPPETDQVADLMAANQVADDWLFERTTPAGQNDAIGATAESLDDDGTVVIDPPTGEDEVIPDATVETLFGNSLEDEPKDETGPDGDTIASLSDLLPDGQSSEAADDFPDNVPDDVYIPASADEDLINLVEPEAEQRLLIDFSDEQLVEQLDEDLQKLAGDPVSTSHGQPDNAPAPLDQSTLETIIRDLDLEDVTIESESMIETASVEETAEAGTNPDDIDQDRDESAAGQWQQATNPPANTDRDLFAGFATDIVDIDDPSADELDLASITSASVNDAEPETQDLDFLGLANDPLNDLLTDELDQFDDGLSDSLADELGGLSEQSNALSQESTEDEIIGQILSDLEEPVVEPDEILEVPTVDEAEPQLDSASLPDVPSEFMADDPDAEDAPNTDDFLQAEQAAFWQTMTDDEQSDDESPQALAAQIESPPDGLEQSEMSSDEALDTASGSAIADDLDDLLGLGDLPPPQNASAEQDDLDFGDLDELFGQSSLPELEALDQNAPDADDGQSTDPLTALGLNVTAPAEERLSEPEVLIPEIDLPPVPTADSAESFGDTAGSDVAGTTPPGTETLVDTDIEGDWFLGLDVGATGLSVVLMNRRTGQVYPLYWQTATDDTKHFRLPAMAVMTAAQETVAVGYDALGDLEDLLDALESTATPTLIGVNRLKPLLKVAVGHGQTLAESEPWLRWSDTVELPMLQVLQAMVALLKYLVAEGQAVGLDSDSLKQIWANLQGVIVGYPTNWPDTYSFNLREAVLAAGLIEQPEQILFVEDAIATILSGLPDPHDPSVLDNTVSLSRQTSLYNCQWQEGTVVISGGAVMTELGLVNLPKDLTTLSYADFALRGFAYAGDALDQDIVCQLLLPEERRQPLSDDADTDIHWDWQGHLTPEEADWSQLSLDGLTLPAVGHVDWPQRYQLQQRLLGSRLGQSLLAAARHLKLVLQQQNQIQITLAGQRWLIKRRHLENLIFLPYIQRINRYLNVLLSHHNVDTQAIKQVVCTGGSASLPAIARWLRQKFPNATIIQDTYASELPHSCSRVAYGLVNLARYPQVLNVTRQQYSDYFLLMELLRVFPQQPLPVGAIMHLLEQRGINTQACHLHILALLEGHLPPGLVPTTADRGLICDRTTDLTTYRALLQTPLFSKTVTESGGQMYIPNEAQAERLRTYVNRLLIDKVQTLEEPLIAQLEVLA